MVQRKKYDKKQLYAAIAAVKNGLSQSRASKKFGVPQSTLSDKMTERYTAGKCKPGN